MSDFPRLDGGAGLDMTLDDTADFSDRAYFIGFFRDSIGDGAGTIRSRDTVSRFLLF